MRQSPVLLILIATLTFAACNKSEERHNTCTCASSFTNFYRNNDTFTLANAFTPNGDGRNDFVKLIRNYGFSVNNYEMAVYKWDNVLVYKTNDYRAGWNGKDFQGNELPEEKYTVRIKFTADDSSKIEHCGCISLLRPEAFTGCITMFGMGYQFEDQYSDSTRLFTYPTGERACN